MDASDRDGHVKRRVKQAPEATRRYYLARRARRAAERAESPPLNPGQALDHAERTAMFKAYREAHGVHALAELCSELYLKGRS